MTQFVDRCAPTTRRWVFEAIEAVEADANRSVDTHLLQFPLTAHWRTGCHTTTVNTWGIELYIKDESTHPTGSLKHRLARSLFLYALCNGWIGPDTTVVEASSGSTAVSEAYFARMLGLPFVAVMPARTSPEKIELIEFYGGRTHLVDDPGAVYDESRQLAEKLGGHFMDQFTYAERATDWRGNNNIAESIFAQMAAESNPVPTWIVVGAGTGGTSATIGRYARYRKLDTRVCVVDPENSAFFPGWLDGDLALRTDIGSRIEGIGRQRVEPSFIPGVIDAMMSVPDAASIAAARFASALLGRPVGGSTGTNIWGSLALLARMHAAGEQGSIVTLLSDSGDRYAHTYFDDSWLREHGLRIEPYIETLGHFADTGSWRSPTV